MPLVQGTGAWSFSPATYLEVRVMVHHHPCTGLPLGAWVLHVPQLGSIESPLMPRSMLAVMPPLAVLEIGPKALPRRRNLLVQHHAVLLELA